MQITPFYNFEEKLKCFPDSLDYLNIETKEEYDKFYVSEIFQNSSNIYRGINEAKFRLYTSIQRVFIEGRINKQETMKSFIGKEIVALKRNDTLQKYFKAIKIPMTDFLYLSFLQHNAAPTSFLDFSHNRDKALYFATENIKYGIGNPNIYPILDEYFSIYWINLKDQINPIEKVTDLYNEGCLRSIDYLKSSQVNDKNINAVNILNLKKFLSWNNTDNQFRGLSDLPFGFIDNNNYYRHYTIGDLDEAQSRLDNFIKRHFIKPTETNYSNLKKVVKYVFDEVIKIVNLNLIAQEGCFIHYLPLEKEYKMPFEDFAKRNRIKIYCANIHKSLAPYIIELNRKKGIILDSIYPNSKSIALGTYNETTTNI